MIRISDIDDAPFDAIPFRAGPDEGPSNSLLPFYRASVAGLPKSVAAIIATGDLQGTVPLTNRGQRRQSLVEAEIKNLQAKGELCSKQSAIAVITGDLYAGADQGDVRGGWLALSAACRWVVGVAGNHDSFGSSQSIREAQLALSTPAAYLLDDTVVALEGLVFGGISGAVGESGQSWSRTEEQFAVVASRLAAQGVDVLISRDGPNVRGTALAGWPAVRRALEAGPPTLLIRGHDPWPHPLRTLENGTQILNVEGRIVVLMPGGDAGTCH